MYGREASGRGLLVRTSSLSEEEDFSSQPARLAGVRGEFEPYPATADSLQRFLLRTGPPLLSGCDPCDSSAALVASSSPLSSP